jgi:hypothetical protein
MIACRRCDFPGAREQSDRNGSIQWIGFMDGERPERSENPRPLLAPSRSVQLSPIRLHRAYSHLLDDLTLSHADWHNLEKVRGFTREAVRRHGFKSFEFDGLGRIIRRLADEFSYLLDVPGFYEKDGRVKFAAQPGLLIPCRDTEGRIVSLRYRPYRPGTGGKYRWVSTPNDGPGPALLASCWKPAVVLNPGAVRVAEGELCAARLAEATGIVTLSAGSVVCMSSPQIQEMIRLLAPAQILLCPDANWRTNPCVSRAVRSALDAYEQSGIPLKVEVW